MKKNTSRSLILLLILGVIFSYFYFDLSNYFNLEYLKSQQTNFERIYKNNPELTILTFFIIYVVSVAFSFPGATILTLAAGGLFGLGYGLLIVSFASTFGATLAFLLSRFLLRETIQKKFSNKLKTFNEGFEKEGAFYLFTLRLVPVFPFFMINLLMGLTPIRTITFFVVSQIGMLPGTFVYINAGTELSKIHSLKGILSPSLLFSFVLLGIFPIFTKKIIQEYKSRKFIKKFKKPKSFDYNLIAIGGGAAGLVTSYIGSTIKAKVALIEKSKMGGDCLNTGCVPSKALIKSANFIHSIKEAEKYGIHEAKCNFKFVDIMNRVQSVIQKIEPHDSIERYTKLGVDCIQGEAKILSPYEVEVEGKKITTKSIVIATGAKPFIPPIENLKKINYLTSENLWKLRYLPKKLIILGGGPIGSELTQAFSRLGSDVTLIEQGPRILSKEDPDISTLIENKFKNEGIKLILGHKAIKVELKNDKKYLVCENLDKKETLIEFEEIIIAVGRKANTENLGLENLQIPLRKDGTIETNQKLQTVYPNIYACGDVAGPFQFTHTAAHQAWYASVNALIPFKKFIADYSVIPWATFTDPEVARVGLNEMEAKKKNIAYEVTTYGIDDLDRAIADEQAHGIVKILTPPGKDKILGVTIVGNQAGELISEFVLSMKHGLGLNKILGTIHIYPTLSEANKYAAGVWKQKHKPEQALQWLEKYFKWRRG
tara:strand:+ start:394 stop:2535 length:2142 start_codon:yes stop_codon:yes gene_type:complete